MYEQKGPILYFLHAFACLIDYDNFSGVFILEIISCILYLYFSLKLTLLFADTKIVPFVGILSAIIYSSALLDKGDSTEELCLWCLVYGLYIGFRIIMRDSELKEYELVALGFIASIVLWTKYLMMGFYIGWIIAICIFMVREKQFAKLRKYFLLSMIGALLCTALVLSYFLINHAVSDLFQVYFYNNIFVYDIGEGNGAVGVLTNLIKNFVRSSIKSIFVSALIVLGLYAAFKIGLQYFGFYACCIGVTAFFIFFKGALFYYAFCLGAFAPMGLLIPYYLTVDKWVFKSRHRAIYTGIILISCLFMSFSPNLKYFSDSKDDFVQYKFRDIILQKENPVILNYGFQDYGFYTVCGLVPECRYFCTFNILSDIVLEEQEQYIYDQKPDFVITANKKNIGDYSLISSGEYYDSVLNISRTYFLYEKQE